MNPYRLLYNAAMLPAAAALAPFAYLTSFVLPGERGTYWRERLGSYANQIPDRRHPGPLLWVHAVSVGEVGVAATLIHTLDQMHPGLNVVLSTSTPQGLNFARNRLSRRAACICFPVDFIVSVHRALRRIQPDLIVCLETELWPNFLGQAHRLGIPTFLLNGRISEKSSRHYRKIRPLLEPTLRRFRALAMISAADARRIVAMGAPASRVVVTGNMKGAGLVEQADPGRLAPLRERLGLGGQPVLVAGSIRAQELSWLPEIYAELVQVKPGLVGIFAPRHLHRIPRLEEWLQRRGLEFQHYSRLAAGREARRAGIILVDQIGALFDLYGLADLVFCGGSLAPLGGQNILEPAAWGKAVFYGGHMDNFVEEHGLLEKAGAGIMVQDRYELLDQLRYYSNRLDELEQRGGRGRKALRERHQVARRQAEVILAALGCR